jgi:tetratricopeptide (TPR) repeat protein
VTQPLEDREFSSHESDECVAEVSTGRSRGRGVFRLLTIVIAAALLAWGVITRAPGEIGRWYHAAALESAEAAQSVGDEPADYAIAIDQVSRAIEWDPSNPGFFLQRSDWYFSSEEYEKALLDAAKVIELAPRHIAGYHQRVKINRRLERFHEVVEDCDTIVELTQGRGFMEHQKSLNGRAYLRAQGNRDLEQALADSEQAVNMLRELEASPQKLMEMRIDPVGLDLLLSQTLDTRAYVRHLLAKQALEAGDGKTAISFLDRALLDYDDAIRGINRVRERLRLLSLKGELQVNQRALEELRQDVVQCSVIHQHRGELYALRGWKRYADADFERAAAMGYDPKHGW